MGTAGYEGSKACTGGYHEERPTSVLDPIECVKRNISELERCEERVLETGEGLDDFPAIRRAIRAAREMSEYMNTPPFLRRRRYVEEAVTLLQRWSSEGGDHARTTQGADAEDGSERGGRHFEHT